MYQSNIAQKTRSVTTGRLYRTALSAAVLVSVSLSAEQATAAPAVLCVATKTSELVQCFQKAEVTQGWVDIRVGRGTYNLSAPLRLTRGKVRLLGAGKYVKAGDQYARESAPDLGSAQSVESLGKARDFVLNGMGVTRVIHATSSAMLYVQGVTITGGVSPDSLGGGGIRFEGDDMKIVHSVLEGNSGSAVWTEVNDQQYITNSLFMYNTAEGALTLVNGRWRGQEPSSCIDVSEWGGALTARGHSDFRVYSSSFIANSACYGGAMWVSADLDLVSSTLSGNAAWMGGGIFFADQPDGYGNAGSITNSTITNNEATEVGGGLAFLGYTNSMTIFGNIIAGNRSWNVQDGSDCYQEQPLAWDSRQNYARCSGGACDHHGVPGSSCDAVENVCVCSGSQAASSTFGYECVQNRLDPSRYDLVEGSPGMDAIYPVSYGENLVGIVGNCEGKIFGLASDSDRLGTLEDPVTPGLHPLALNGGIGLQLWTHRPIYGGLAHGGYCSASGEANGVCSTHANIDAGYCVDTDQRGYSFDETDDSCDIGSIQR
jgi:hypothetical protein